MPYNLNINELNQTLTGKTGTSLITHKVLNFYTVIIKKLINSIFFDKEAINYVFINHKEREALLGDQYERITKLLVNADYLLEDSTWIYNASGKGNRTKAYALPTWMFTSHKMYRLFEISPNKVISNMIEKFNNLRLKNTECDQWRAEMIKSSHRILLHNTEESRKAIQAHIDKINDRIKLNNENKTKKKKKLGKAKRIFQLNIDAVDFINLFNYSPFNESVVDLFGKRTHSKVTRIPKAIRPFLYFENRPTEKLMCVDIVNSQPAFMSVATSTIINRFTPELWEAKEIVQKYQDNNDLDRFRELCADGRIYETIQSYFSSKGKIITRDEAKVLCFTSFFGNYLPFEMGKLKNEFKQMAYDFLRIQFKGVYNMYKEMKMGKWAANRGKMYANNCMLAQRIESQIFYTVIVPAIWNANNPLLCPEGFRDFTTIHDSILCPESDGEVIRNIMIREFEKLNIKLKVA